MKQFLHKFTIKILTYAEHALLDIICLHEIGMTSMELGHFLPASTSNDHEVRYTASIAQAKDLEMTAFSPKLDTNNSQASDSAQGNRFKFWARYRGKSQGKQ